MEKDIIYNATSENMHQIPDNSVDLIVTSPPYNININYGNKTEQGKVVASKGKKYSDNLEEEEYQRLLQTVFSECRRVLKPNGSIWINIKNRTKNGIVEPPFWLQNHFNDMYLKNILIWNFDWGGSTSKRFAPRYEYVFWYTASNTEYTFNLEDVKIPALNYRPDRYKNQLKNPSDVWRIPMVSGNFLERTDHPAQYPEKLIERIILSGSNKGDIILDPFMGSGTTAVVAKKLKRHYIGYELEPDYIEITDKRLDVNFKSANIMDTEQIELEFD
ncbi:DNA-methyltransferase [Rummeliibacillus pycnus]|uniref:DNA-methyltransferase n=1 Tax=Rummeliibacillus pycnus TaxID=101070 RepID=UPI003D2BDE54